ncbi:MAG: cation diffusion facilitator family transporter [Chitinivibrionales bacterium]|nr:cation diffusion facilitator family transporter [Chitinivibrionales bacterium]
MIGKGKTTDSEISYGSVTSTDIQRRNAASLVVNLGIAANAILAVCKLGAGILGHSQALLADGVNSIADVVYFIVVRIFVSFSAKPADNEHPYGHHQFESIAALVVGAFVLTSGLAIFWQSANSAFDMLTTATDTPPVQQFTLWVAVFTILLKIVLMLHAKKISHTTRNIALSAIAKDHRNDIIASTGAALGILFSLTGFPWVDPIAGAIVAILVTKAGIDILRESAADLMDAVPGKELASAIGAELKSIDAVRQVEAVKAHRFGPYYVVNVTVGVDGHISVFQGDKIADQVEETLLKNIDMLRHVYVHYHPVGAGECE